MTQAPRQLALPELTTAEANGSGFHDPAFMGNKTQPVHRWVPWIAGFSRDFVQDALIRYLPQPGVVLDPFAGVGTTLVEAVWQGHQAIGFEINPYAALACQAKTRAGKIPLETFQAEIKRLQTFYHERVATDYHPQSTPPPGFRTRGAFYSPAVLRKVLIVQDFIAALPESALADLFRLAFSATMVRYSNYSYEPSLGRRASAGKPEIVDFPVGETIFARLQEMAADIAWVQANPCACNPDVRIINASFFQYERHLAPRSVDLLITSPPYLNNYHYNRNTRPQLYWLGYAKAPSDLIPLEQDNFGTYWQTVREKETVELTFTPPGSGLVEQLTTLRSLNTERGIYGGNGWANYAAAYFNDCYRFAQGIRYALKPGGTALVVIGNSILQGVFIPTDEYLGQIAVAVGLELVQIDIPRTARVGNSIIQSTVRVTQAQSAHRLYEAIVELRQPR